jgi:hypothetical protein
MHQTFAASRLHALQKALRLPVAHLQKHSRINDA